MCTLPFFSSFLSWLLLPGGHTGTVCLSIPFRSACLFWWEWRVALEGRVFRERHHRWPVRPPGLARRWDWLAWQDASRSRRIAQPTVGVVVQVKHDLGQGRSQEQPDQPELAGDDQDDQQDHRVNRNTSPRKEGREQPVAQEMDRYVEQQDRQRRLPGG